MGTYTEKMPCNGVALLNSHRMILITKFYATNIFSLHELKSQFLILWSANTRAEPKIRGKINRAVVVNYQDVNKRLFNLIKYFLKNHMSIRTLTLILISTF